MYFTARAVCQNSDETKKMFMATSNKLVILNMAVFWDIPPFSLVDTDKGFKAAYYLHHQDKP
jgi:hypothetical protein